MIPMGGSTAPAPASITLAFAAADATFNALVGPATVRIDGILGINNQPIAVGDILRPLLKACNGYLGRQYRQASSRIQIDGPPTEYKLALGAGPTAWESERR